MTDTHLHTQSSTAVVLDELQLYGWRPFTNEPDPRPLPKPDAIHTAVADIFDALVSTLSDTRLEPDLEDLLWSSTNLFHRMATRISRDLDSNEQAQKRAQREQDGSEVRSVELETLIAEGITLIERRNAYETMRDLAAELFETHLGQTWHPHAGSHVKGPDHPPICPWNAPDQQRLSPFASRSRSYRTEQTAQIITKSTYDTSTFPSRPRAATRG